MRKLLLVAAFIAVGLKPGFAQQQAKARRTKGVIVAFFDEERLRNRIDGQATLKDFEFFLNVNKEIAKQNFPEVEFRILKAGELLRLPDGTGLNVQNIQPVLGYVFSMRGKKHVVLSGPQSDVDFACAVAAFFRRPSSSCSP
jgi:hypothetical protein